MSIALIIGTMCGCYRKVRKKEQEARARFWLARALESFGEFFSERAGRALRTIRLRRTLVLFSAPLAAWRTSGGAIHWTGRPSPSGHGSLRSWRLGLIGPQQSIFERRAVKAPDDRVHFFRVGGVDKGESLRLLRLWVSDHLDIVVYEVFCVKPGLNIVLGNPDRQVSEEYCKAHSRSVVNSVGDLAELLRGCDP
jgi:hypothetical protein